MQGDKSMHKDDQMTSNERMQNYFEGKDIDRLPAMPFIDSIGAVIAGTPHREKRKSAENQAKVQLICYEKLGNDGLSIEYGLHGIGAACGSELDDPENAVQSIKKYAMESLDDMKHLDLNAVRKENDPWFNMNYDACQICLDKLGQEVGTSVCIPGPFTAAASLFPLEKLLISLRKRPEETSELLRFATEAVKIVGEGFASTGVDIFLADPIASCDIISEKCYRQYVLPYKQEIVKHIQKHKVAVGYHICGNTLKIAEAMLESGCDMLSVDTKVDLEFAKKIAGSKMPIIGNVDPINTMMLGTVEDVYENVKDNIRKCADSPCGYIVSNGCDIPVNAPVENVYAFMDAVRKYGKWPVNLEVLR